MPRADEFLQEREREAFRGFEILARKQIAAEIHKYVDDARGRFEWSNGLRSEAIMELYRCWQCMNGMGQSNDGSDMQGYIFKVISKILEN